MRVSLYIALFLTFFAVVSSKAIYNSKKSYVMPLTKLNFDAQITKIRQSTKLITIVQYYKYADGESRSFANDFDEFTNEYRGVFKIAACDCDEDIDICEKEKITKFPTFRIYPPFPIPAIDYEGVLDTKQLLNFAAKYLQSNVIEITPANIDTFINDSPSVPKVLLFTDKKGLPTIYKGLSVSFEKKLFFGIIRSEHKSLMDRYNVKETPKILVVKTTEKKPNVYKGDMKFMSIHDFLNIYSEVFVPGGGSTQDSAATKVWLTELVPELNMRSANDICLKVEGSLCVILLSKKKPEKSLIDVLKEAHALYDRKISRGSQFKFMWMDAERESAWTEMLFPGDFPAVVVLNPGKRKRFLVHEGPISTNSIKETLDKINGGDAHFTQIKLQDWPEFVHLKE